MKGNLKDYKYVGYEENGKVKVVGIDMLMKSVTFCVGNFLGQGLSIIIFSISCIEVHLCSQEPVGDAPTSSGVDSTVSAVETVKTPPPVDTDTGETNRPPPRQD